MDQASAVEYRRAEWRGRWLGGLLGVLALLALLFGAPGLLVWLPGAALGALGPVVVAAALFLLPGLALLRLFWPERLPLAERLVLAAGLSCAVPPLLLLASAPLGLRWGPLACWSLLALCAGAAFWPQRAEPTPLASPRPLWWRDAPGMLLLLVSVGALLARLYATRELVAGQFGDSYHHTIIAQLLLDHGGLFSSWRPYAPLSTFTYHYGFHSLVAWLHWLSGYPLARGVVAIGQIEGALAAPLLGLLAARLFGDRRVAPWTALAVGLLSLYPAYYVNWGRYTQLAGQTVLPAACVIWMALLERAATPRTSWQALLRLATLAALATAGVVLSHYRIGAFAACFVAVYGLYMLAVRVRAWSTLARLALVGGAVGLASGLLVLPWLLRLREGLLLRVAGAYMSSNVGAEIGNSYSPADWERAAAHGLLPLALFGLGALTWQRRWAALVLPAWAALVWLAANPFLVGLHGAGIISSFAVVIAAYLVLGPLAGAGLLALGDSLVFAIKGRRERRVWQERLWQVPKLTLLAPALPLLLGAVLAAWGLSLQAGVVDLSFRLLTPADEAAMAWVRANTPHTARFFANSAPAYGDTIYVGTDGGWWLSFLTGRPSNLDPISYGMEAAERPGYHQIVIERNQPVLAHAANSQQAAAALRAQGYSYLYDGPAANPAPEFLRPAELAASPLYQRVYNANGVTIWRLR